MYTIATLFKKDSTLQTIELWWAPMQFIFGVAKARALPTRKYVLPCLFPGNSLGPIRLINSLFCIRYLRAIQKSLGKGHLLWITDSYFYYLHNYIGWNFLVFDYQEGLLLERNLYKPFISKKQVFLFHVEDDKKIETVLILKKKKNYRKQILSLALQ